MKWSIFWCVMSVDIPKIVWLWFYHWPGAQTQYKHVLCFQTLYNACGWTHICILVSYFMHVHVCCCCFCINDHLLKCDFSDSGGFSRKSVAVSLVLSPMKRVQSSPNLSTGTNTVKNTTCSYYIWIRIHQVRPETAAALELHSSDRGPLCCFQLWLLFFV